MRRSRGIWVKDLKPTVPVCVIMKITLRVKITIREWKNK